MTLLDSPKAPRRVNRQVLLAKLEAEAMMGYPPPWEPEPEPEPTRVCRNGHTITRWQQLSSGACGICRNIAAAKRKRRPLSDTTEGTDR